MEKNKPSNIKHFRRRGQNYLGTIVFGLVFVYIICCVVLYFTRNRVSIYEVTTGQIVENYTFTGLALRTEQLVTATDSGYLTYLSSEGSRVGAKTAVYAVTTDGPLASVISDSTDTISEEYYDEIVNELNGFRAGYSDNTFQNIYTFKSGLNASLLEAYGSTQTTYTELYGVQYAAESGIVVYNTDGFENITYESFTADMLNKNNYTCTELTSRETIAAGDTAYKLVTAETWEIIVKIDGTQRNKFEDDDYVEVRFLKDNQTAWAQISKFELDGDWYCRLQFTNSMVRYATERYLEIDVMLDTASGLKVPNSAIVEKKFYTVPLEYLTVDEDEGTVGFFVYTEDEEGNGTQTYTELTPYNMTDALAYLDMEDIEEGTVIVKEGTTESYTVEVIDKLVGVYNVNKGYADFSLVTIAYQNDEYSIVTPNESYGLTQYDHIVLDGSSVNDEETIYQQ